MIINFSKSRQPFFSKLKKSVRRRTEDGHSLLSILMNTLCLGGCKKIYKGDSFYSCLYPIRWQISYQSEERGCSIALLNSWLIYLALSFIYLLESETLRCRVNESFILKIQPECQNIKNLKSVLYFSKFNSILCRCRKINVHCKKKKT